MHINVYDKITLSNHKKYLVISKINYDENTYYYLLDIDTNKDIKICYENSNNQSMVEIKDKKFLEKIFPLFLKNSQEEIMKVLEDQE